MARYRYLADDEPNTSYRSWATKGVRPIVLVLTHHRRNRGVARFVGYQLQAPLWA